jgi:hypothetical protein
VFSQRLDVFRWTEASDPTPAARVRYDWALYFDPPPGVLMEKTPTDTLRSRWLQKNFTPSRFIVIVRNPYAVSEGIRRRRNHLIEEAATHWKCVHEILQEDMKYLDHCFWLRYEDLCEKPEECLNRIESFLELERPFEREVLGMTFQADNMDHTEGGIRNFNAKSLGRLSAEDIEIINKIAGEQMRQFGYEPIHNL